MKRIALRFPRPFKLALWGAFCLSWITGVSWFVLHRWFRVEGEFGEEHSAWEPLLMKIHGGAAMLMMIYFGYLLASHVPVGLRSRRNRALGLALLSALGFMIVTAYGLYYIGGEGFHSVISWAHLGVGFCLPFLLALHIVAGHKGSLKKTSSSSP